MTGLKVFVICLAAGALGYMAVGLGYVLNQPWLMNYGTVAAAPLAVFMAVLLVAVARRY